ncbi:hypothetical protein A2363_04775 [Candidatus Gottesmanbacteria bacterium RIFOXYB1_FULL_47_11]|uniref:Glycosyltransferase 2-like domain-containing protein n=1 Tax=Candidatus Gottesmanbacteria bacterium RIFOXYB1_FULL_47_11 TaxID=1798401 RepID=A0A1F6BC40_9BACT|nr:MAG: hypothetical protein A2363_04775 [Candidatus Gottesmanbacteria bacterium RIFOXYB1_FULL_47_11]
MKNNQTSYRDTAVVIPAYRECDNLKILLPRLITILPGASIIIVDDSEQTQKYRGAIVLARSGKKGRGSAVLHGLKHALTNRRVQYIIEMDADLAHAPEECPALVAAAVSADMVIGSRYLPGSVIENWPMYRLVQSRIINVFLRYLLGLRLTDFTNGFRLYTRPVAEFLLKTPMKEKGFIALSEIAYKVKKQGFRIAEIPVSFTDRKFGKSNANIRELLASLVGAFRIRIG